MKFEKVKNWAKEILKTVDLLKLAYKDPRVPWYAKAFSSLIIAYAISPIDLIPDFIPIIGYIDDLIIVPLGISLALKMIPKNILQEYKDKLN